MDLGLSDEQQQFRDSLRRFFAERCSFEHRRALLASERGSSPEVWRQLAELGALGIAVPEAFDGLGGSTGEQMLVMEEIGRALVLEPYLGSVVICGGLLARSGNDSQRRELLPALVAGRLQLALAHFEPGHRYEAAQVATRARPDGGGWVLDGRKTFVLHGAHADRLLVTARTAGDDDDVQGITLLLVGASSPGVGLHAYRMHDGQRGAELRLDGVRVDAAAVLGTVGGALPDIEYAVDLANAALCAEAVGAMGALLEITLQYLKTRRQFGVPIGSFQALQHRMADMRLHLEQAQSMASLAADALDEVSAAQRQRRVSAAKVLVAQAARFVGQQAVQLHGGIGVTDEINVSHYFRRLTLIAASFGDADHHLGVVSDALLEDSRHAGRSRESAPA